MLALSMSSCHGIDWFLIPVPGFSRVGGREGLSWLVQRDAFWCLESFMADVSDWSSRSIRSRECLAGTYPSLSLGLRSQLNT